MKVEKNWGRLRSRTGMLACCALVLGSLACDGRYSHGRIPVDKETKQRWDAGEREAEEAGKQITPIPPGKDSPDQVPVEALSAVLAHVDSSTRHGAGDKRLLSLRDSTGFRSANILAEIVLVKGSEYKAEKDFKAGWIPLAIIYRPATKGLSDAPYDKLALSNAPVSWVFVRQLSDSRWIGSLVHREEKGFVQLPLSVTVPESDHVEPVIGARFVWRDDDEGIWAYCAGKCCQMRK